MEMKIGGVSWRCMLCSLILGLPVTLAADEELPDDPKLLKAMVRMLNSSLRSRDAEITKLKKENAVLSRRVDLVRTARYARIIQANPGRSDPMLWWLGRSICSRRPLLCFQSQGQVSTRRSGCAREARWR